MRVTRIFYDKIKNTKTESVFFGQCLNFPARMAKHKAQAKPRMRADMHEHGQGVGGRIQEDEREKLRASNRSGCCSVCWHEPGGN